MARVKHGTLTANTVSQVTALTVNGSGIEITNVNGAAPLYVRLDGTNPTVAGDDCDVVPGVGSLIIGTSGNAPYDVRLISAAATTYGLKVV